MKGLLTKDFRLMVKQSRFFTTIVFIAVIFVAVVKNTSFVVSYLTFIGSLFTLSTINYDEFDNGNAFLFSLPITRRGYVMEKYAFGFIIGGCCWLFAALIAMIGGQVRGTNSVYETLMTALAILPILLLMLAMMIPFQLKFGGDKGRIAAVATAGVIFISLLGAAKIADIMHIDLEGLLDNLQAMDLGMLIMGAILVAVVALLLSVRISVSIMEKKEF